LYRHLCAERKKRVKRRDGQVVEAWVAHDSQNHLRDCLAYATAAAGLAGVLEMRPRVKVAEPSADPVETVQTSTAPAAPPAPVKPSTALQRLAAARNAGTLGTARGFRAS
jgi:phage terminase large subunit GpA-like protein